MSLSFIAFPVARLRTRQVFNFRTRRFSHEKKMRVLNVAEKNDAAKNIAALLSSGRATTRNSTSVYNKIYEFDYNVFEQNCRMIMTSVSGHVLQTDFTDCYKSWRHCDPVLLFDAPIMSSPTKESIDVKKCLEKEIKSCSKLIIWTDCDREGENIGFEVINICKAVKSNIEVHRAKFSEITQQSVTRALRNLGTPLQHVSDAVEVRKELDLRIGAAFTRFQTLYLQKAFPDALAESVISFGSCQFPTLGFVVEQFKTVSDFKPEKFWEVNVQHTVNDTSVTFQWSRNKLFNKLACEVLYEKCGENRTATVEDIESKPQVKRRPKPLDTVELQKLASKKLRVNAKETLRIAENLYTRGFISYPRTETTIFSKEIDLPRMVQQQTNDPQWGGFAQKVLRDGPDPFQGKKTDQAHPPIHPILYTNSLSGNERRIYELIVRHFLACLSKHAEGLETIVHIDVAGEKFSAKGLVVTAANYLDVYPYEKWEEKPIHLYRKGEVFLPEILMVEGETSPPSLLTESDLIALMEKHGIGTDATHADHIETIKQRLYVGLQDEKYFVPRTLGMGLVEGYNNMGLCMAKPELRAELEADLKKICEKEEVPVNVLSKYITKYKKIYRQVERQVSQLSGAIQNYIRVTPAAVDPSVLSTQSLKKVGVCPSCRSDLVLKTKKNGGKFVSCSAYPNCRALIWFPSFVLDASVTADTCSTCGPTASLIHFKFQKGSCSLPSDYVGCIGGCDWYLLEILNGSERKKLEPRSRAADVPALPSARGNDDSGFVSHTENSVTDDVTFADSPKCHCGLSAILLKSKKSKEFYKCGNPRNADKCNFFMWKDALELKDRLENTPFSTDGEEEIRCFCSMPCKRFTTTKEGPNKGRNFYSCGKTLNDPGKCNFFKWADEDERQGSHITLSANKRNWTESKTNNMARKTKNNSWSSWKNR